MSRRFSFPYKEVLGTHVHAATMGQALDAVDDAIASGERLMVGVVNAAKIVRMNDDAELSSDVNNSDLILADGMSVVHASRILGKALPERVTGIDLMTGILERGNPRGYRVFCLGATEDVSRTVERRFKERYPGVKLVGRCNGYFSAVEEQHVVDAISATRPDVLFVAITSPKKERFMAKWAGLLDATVIHGVGGSFDVIAGKVERAPQCWQDSGLEWLYRVKQEPRRLWRRYLVTNLAFIWMLIKHLLFGRKAVRNKVPE